MNTMISKELLKEVLLEANKKTAIGGEFVEREKINDIEKFIPLKHTVIITGVRRCGKSTFLFQTMKKFPNGFYYVNFEDERLFGFSVNDFNSLYEVCIELFGERRVFFLDEIQNIDGWEKWVRRMYESGFKFFITGSNARLLSKELATVLTGRHLQVSLYPFSFMEFLKFNSFDFKKEDMYLTERRALIKKLFSMYLADGGFPDYLKYRRIEILQEYFNDIIQRDIVERYGISNIKQLKELARYLITNVGNLTTYNQLKKMTEIKSVNTVIKYFSYLENAYLVFSVPYFSYSMKKQSANPFKVFAVDVGLRNSISFKFSEDIGRLYENIVALELKRRGKEFYYWKDKYGKEVDFLIKDGNEPSGLVQVCWRIENLATKQRELKGLLAAMKEFNFKDGLVVTEDFEGEERIMGKTIKYIPLWKWLLEKL